MPAASTTFANLPELLVCLAEEICSRRQLATLCLVNKAFNAACTPALYRELDIEWELECNWEEECNWKQPRQALASHRHLRHVRSLIFSCVRRMEERPQASAWLATKLLPKMPRLESFTWMDTPLSNDVLRALRDSCPRIKTIDVTFPPDIGVLMGYDLDNDPDGPYPEELGLRATCGKPNFTIFSNLQELRLDEIYEELPWWRSQLVKVLKNCPGLQRLDLSLSAETVLHYAEFDEREKVENWFDQLCDEYGETGAAPLRLRTLHFGTALYPAKVESLKKLTDLAFLQDVHIANRNLQSADRVVNGRCFTYLNFMTIETAWDAFGPANSPNLRRLSAVHYSYYLKQFLASIAGSAFSRKLAVHFQHGSESMGRHLSSFAFNQSVPLHLRMLSLELRRREIRYPEPLYPEEEEDDDDDLDEELDATPRAKWTLEDLVSGDDGTLEGLTIRLAVEGDGFQFANLLCDALGQLGNLTQLAVLAHGEEDEKRLWQEKGMLYNTARMLAGAGGRLRYIRVYSLFWSVWRSPDGDVRLEEMADEEIAEVELFELLYRHPWGRDGWVKESDGPDMFEESAESSSSGVESGHG